MLANTMKVQIAVRVVGPAASQASTSPYMHWSMGGGGGVSQSQLRNRAVSVISRFAAWTGARRLGAGAHGADATEMVPGCELFDWLRDLGWQRFQLVGDPLLESGKVRVAWWDRRQSARR